MSEISVLPFFRSYWEAAKSLPDADRLKIYDGIFSFAFEGEEPLLEGVSSCFWILSRPNIEKSLNRARANIENGGKGGRPPKTEEKPNENPNETELKPIKKADISLNKEQGIKNKEQGIKNKEQGIKNKERYSSTKRFVPPTLEEVREYCLERGNSIDPERFIDYYQANGWVQSGGKKIKDWRACVRTWERNDLNSPKAEQPKDDPYSFFD